MWHWLQIKLERLAHFIYSKGVLDIFSEPMSFIIIPLVIIVFICFRFFRRK
jgi:hypothetical protein